MKITTQNHILVFTDRSTMVVTKEVANKVLELSASEQVGTTINGNFYKFTAIAKILDMPEYYRQYPDKIPVQVKEFSGIDLLPINRATSKGAMNGLIKGIKLYISEQSQKGIVPNNANQLLKDAEKRLRLLEN